MPKTTKAAAQADQIAGLLRHAVPHTEPEPAPAETRERKQPATRQRKTDTQPPAERKAKDRYERIPFMAEPEQRKALAAARVEDGIEATTRLRAMVKLWMESPQFRKKVNDLAKADRDRDRRARGYNR